MEKKKPTPPKKQAEKTEKVTEAEKLEKVEAEKIETPKVEKIETPKVEKIIFNPNVPETIALVSILTAVLETPETLPYASVVMTGR